MAMAMPQREMNRPMNLIAETAEVKKRIARPQVDEDSLSEWELARMTSKTWSMEQD